MKLYFVGVTLFVMGLLVEIIIMGNGIYEAITEEEVFCKPDSVLVQPDTLEIIKEDSSGNYTD